MKRTLLTIKQQNEWLSRHHVNSTLIHKWSTRGYGSSRIINKNDEVLAKARGYGYDRYGAALGGAIMELFPKEVYKLAKKYCKGRSQTRKTSPEFYGLFFNKTEDRAYVDGGCGSNSMLRILNKIGFSLRFTARSERSRNGEEFYILEPITKHDRYWLK